MTEKEGRYTKTCGNRTRQSVCACVSRGERKRENGWIREAQTPSNSRSKRKGVTSLTYIKVY